MKILLHICCGNCSTYPFMQLAEEKHSVTGYWFNPNIHPFEEYRSRLESLRKLQQKWGIDVYYEEDYRPEEYFSLFSITDNDLIKKICYNDLNSTDILNTFDIPAVPDRCRSCYSLRLEKTAKKAKKLGFDAFTTTLLISTYQDFEGIKTAGENIAETHNIEFYLRDFRPFFRDSKTLSVNLGLYRQKYCGCFFSLKEKNYKGFKGSRSQGVR